jgi:hypothetical protein
LTDFLTRAAAERIFGKEQAELLSIKEQEIVTTVNIRERNALVEQLRQRYDLEEKPLIAWWQEESKGGTEA